MLRMLQWKAEHPGTSAAAVNNLKNVFGPLPSWFKCVSLAKRLAPGVTVNEYPCCPESHYAYTDRDLPTTAEERAAAKCAHCNRALYCGDVPIKTYPVFPISPRLQHQYYSRVRATCLRYRFEHCESINGKDSVIRDYVDADVYKDRNHAARFPDQYTHALAISMDGFQIFKQ